jgi:DNA-binding transcriptional MocR family regulator
MIEQPYFEWQEPDAGVVCFPRIKKEWQIDTEKMYRILYDQHKTIVGPGHWFEQDDRSMRIGFGYPDAEQLHTGLMNLEQAIKASLK